MPTSTVARSQSPVRTTQHLVVEPPAALTPVALVSSSSSSTAAITSNIAEARMASEHETSETLILQDLQQQQQQQLQQQQGRRITTTTTATTSAPTSESNSRVASFSYPTTPASAAGVSTTSGRGTGGTGGTGGAGVGVPRTSSGNSSYTAVSAGHTPPGSGSAGGGGGSAVTDMIFECHVLRRRLYVAEQSFWDGIRSSNCVTDDVLDGLEHRWNGAVTSDLEHLRHFGSPKLFARTVAKAVMNGTLNAHTTTSLLENTFETVFHLLATSEMTRFNTHDSPLLSRPVSPRRRESREGEAGSELQQQQQHQQARGGGGGSVRRTAMKSNLSEMSLDSLSSQQHQHRKQQQQHQRQFHHSHQQPQQQHVVQESNRLVHHSSDDGHSPSSDDDGPRTVNQYTILQPMGFGSQGTVFLGIDRKTNEFRAIKEVFKPSQNVPGARAQLAAMRIRERLQQEVDVMKLCIHPHLVTLYEVIDDPTENSVYLVFKYIQHGPVIAVAPDGSLAKGGSAISLPKVARFGRQLCSALAFLHEHGIVHRDIKPDNVLLGNDDNVYLGDFGISEMLRKTANSAPTGEELQRARALSIALSEDGVRSIGASASLGGMDPRTTSSNRSSIVAISAGGGASSFLASHSAGSLGRGEGIGPGGSGGGCGGDGGSVGAGGGVSTSSSMSDSCSLSRSGSATKAMMMEAAASVLSCEHSELLAPTGQPFAFSRNGHVPDTMSPVSKKLRTVPPTPNVRGTGGGSPQQQQPQNLSTSTSAGDDSEVAAWQRAAQYSSSASEMSASRRSGNSSSPSQLTSPIVPVPQQQLPHQAHHVGSRGAAAAIGGLIFDNTPFCLVDREQMPPIFADMPDVVGNCPTHHVAPYYRVSPIHRTSSGGGGGGGSGGGAATISEFGDMTQSSLAQSPGESMTQYPAGILSHGSSVCGGGGGGGLSSGRGGRAATAPCAHQQQQQQQQQQGLPSSSPTGAAIEDNNSSEGAVPPLMYSSRRPAVSNSNNNSNNNNIKNNESNSGSNYCDSNSRRSSEHSNDISTSSLQAAPAARTAPALPGFHAFSGAAPSSSSAAAGARTPATGISGGGGGGASNPGLRQSPTPSESHGPSGGDAPGVGGVTSSGMLGHNAAADAAAAYGVSRRSSAGVAGGAAGFSRVHSATSLCSGRAMHSRVGSFSLRGNRSFAAYHHQTVSMQGSLGTRAFLAPEILVLNDGAPEHAEPREDEVEKRFALYSRADVWSLGVTLYFMIYGSLPFHAASGELNYVENVCDVNVPVPYPERVPSGAALPSSLRKALKMMLQKDPAKRANANELRKIFRDLDYESEVWGADSMNLPSRVQLRAAARHLKTKHRAKLEAAKEFGELIKEGTITTTTTGDLINDDHTHKETPAARRGGSANEKHRRNTDDDDDDEPDEAFLDYCRSKGSPRHQRKKTLPEIPPTSNNTGSNDDEASLAHHRAALPRFNASACNTKNSSIDTTLPAESFGSKRLSLMSDTHSDVDTMMQSTGSAHGAHGAAGGGDAPLVTLEEYRAFENDRSSSSSPGHPGDRDRLCRTSTAKPSSNASSYPIISSPTAANNNNNNSTTPPQQNNSRQQQQQQNTHFPLPTTTSGTNSTNSNANTTINSDNNSFTSQMLVPEIDVQGATPSTANLASMTNFVSSDSSEKNFTIIRSGSEKGHDDSSSPLSLVGSSSVVRVESNVEPPPPRDTFSSTLGPSQMNNAMLVCTNDNNTSISGARDAASAQPQHLQSSLGVGSSLEPVHSGSVLAASTIAAAASGEQVKSDDNSSATFNASYTVLGEPQQVRDPSHRHHQSEQQQQQQQQQQQPMCYSSNAGVVDSLTIRCDSTDSGSFEPVGPLQQQQQQQQQCGPSEHQQQQHTPLRYQHAFAGAGPAAAAAAEGKSSVPTSTDGEDSFSTPAINNLPDELSYDHLLTREGSASSVTGGDHSRPIITVAQAVGGGSGGGGGNSSNYLGGGVFPNGSSSDGHHLAHHLMLRGGGGGGGGGAGPADHNINMSNNNPNNSTSSHHARAMMGASSTSGFNDSISQPTLTIHACAVTSVTTYPLRGSSAGDRSDDDDDDDEHHDDGDGGYVSNDVMSNDSRLVNNSFGTDRSSTTAAAAAVAACGSLRRGYLMSNGGILARRNSNNSVSSSTIGDPGRSPPGQQGGTTPPGQHHNQHQQQRGGGSQPHTPLSLPRSTVHQAQQQQQSSSSLTGGTSAGGGAMYSDDRSDSPTLISTGAATFVTVSSQASTSPASTENSSVCGSGGAGSGSRSRLANRAVAAIQEQQAELQRLLRDD